MPHPQPLTTPAPDTSGGETLHQLFVMGSSAQALHSLAAIAPGLSEAELRVCIHLATIQNPQTHTAIASSREIADSTRLARSNVQRALDSLARRSLIATRQGTSTRPAAHLLNWTQTCAFPGGLTVGPPLQLQLPEMHQEIPRVALQQGHPSEPPLHARADSDDLIDKRSIDRSSSQTPILDQVLTARPQHFQASQLQRLRGYAYKWLTLQRAQSSSPAPDDLTLAQIATAAGGVEPAISFILDNLRDRQATTCQYLVTMLLQKLHGVAPHSIRARRAQLHAVNRSDPQPNATDKPGPDFAADLVAKLAAGAKTLR